MIKMITAGYYWYGSGFVMTLLECFITRDVKNVLSGYQLINKIMYLNTMSDLDPCQII